MHEQQPKRFSIRPDLTRPNFFPPKALHSAQQQVFRDGGRVFKTLKHHPQSQPYQKGQNPTRQRERIQKIYRIRTNKVRIGRRRTKRAFPLPVFEWAGIPLCLKGLKHGHARSHKYIPWSGGELVVAVVLALPLSTADWSTGGREQARLFWTCAPPPRGARAEPRPTGRAPCALARGVVPGGGLSPSAGYGRKSSVNSGCVDGRN